MAGTVSRGPPPIDRGWSWMICIGTFLYVFFMVGLAKCYGLILAALIKEFGIDTATATLPMSFVLLVYAFGAPTAIIIAQHFTIRSVVFVGAIIGFAGIALSSLLFNIVYFIMTFGLFYGIGNSCFYGNGMIMIGRYFKVRRSLANGLALSGASIGQFALPPLVEYLLDNYGLSGTLLLVGALYLHGAITGLLFRPIEQYDPVVEMTVEKKPIVKDGRDGVADEKADNCNGGTHDEKKLLTSKDSENDCSDSNKDGLDFEDKKRMVIGSQGSIFMLFDDSPDPVGTNKLPTEEKRGRSRNILFKIVDFRLLKNYVTIFLTAVSFLCFLGYFNFILFLPSLVKEKGIEKYDKAFLISICGIGDLIARVSVGYFADLNIIPRYRIKALACFFCGINIFMFILADSFIWLGIHCFLYGFLGGAYVCMITLVVVDLVGLAAMGPNLAVVLFIQGLGSSAGNPFLGWLKDLTGSFVIVCVVCAMSLCLGAILLFMYPLVKRVEEKRKANAMGSSNL